MKYIKIAIVILLVMALIFGGYKVYGLYKQWDAKRYNEINMLRTNQDMFLKKVTTLSESLTHIVNDTVKTTVEVKPDYTYESLKEQVIELKQDEETNKEEIEKLREELSAQRKAFLASDDTIYIKTIDDDTLLIYRDEDDVLQPASANIDKIIEHRELSSVVPILAEEEIANRKDNLIANLKFGGYYNITDKEYGLIISKGIFSWKPYSVNASLLISDFEDVKFAIGGDIGYSISDDFLVGVGYSTDNQYYIKLQYSF